MNAMPPRLHLTLRTSLAGLAAAGVLATVFWAYLDPHTVVDLAGRLWSCFG
jgi:hypothetical protein